ncbi:hypothetical protein SAMN05444355_101289 [Flavobacterium frigoris]|uniref:Uncharacterized protein n=1 Tax=Flavobacterium frigoris TaxID=229204 RepID=A0A1H9CW82_FLAFI|nr:hypothetical protein SAMN05444355_101289 [Flavobacterium frigoris]
MRDGSGNPFMQRSEIKDCNVQRDAAVTEWKLGHAQKKSLLKISKGIWFFIMTGFNYSSSLSSSTSFSTASL